ncbi:MAG: NHL repeat-containing protein [Gammaproteobacteria bacterium]|nr:NHL repeat-containing protein [Gammaproteobacteria bacterium]
MNLHYTGISLARLLPVLCLLQACATTAGLFGLGKEQPQTTQAAVVECEPDSASMPLAKWTSLSGNILVRPAFFAGGPVPDVKYIQLTAPVAVAAIASTLYIVDAGQRAILGFDRGTQTASILATVPELGVRAGLFVDRAYTLYLAEPVSSAVTLYDIDGNLFETLSNYTEMPQPVAVVTSTGGDEIFVGDELAAHILVFNRGGTLTRSIGTGTGTDVRFLSVTGMASGPDQLYVSDRLGHQVHALAPDGSYRYGFGKDDLQSPGALAIDSYNRVYVADNGDNTIKVFRGGLLEAVVGAADDPVGLGFQVISSLWQSDGLMYVADAARASIDILKVMPPCQ